MTIAKRFEDLEIWQQARALSKKIRDTAESTKLSRDYALGDQILRSGGSVMDNIAEGFERNGKKEFINFLYIAKGSLGETRSQLHRMSDSNYINSELYNELLSDCLNLSAKISHLISYLSQSELKGPKYK